MSQQFRISLFSRWPRGAGRLWWLHVYLAIGQFELCIDADGALICTPSRTFGFIGKAGWHHSRFCRAPEGSL